MTTVTIALPDDLLATLHLSPIEVQAEVRLAARRIEVAQVGLDELADELGDG